MKYTTIICFLISFYASAQTQIKSGVYTWDDQQTGAYGKRAILAGQTRFFNSFEFSAITLPVNGKNSHSQSTTDHEQLIIVKEGELTVLFDNDKKNLGQGGVAHILPGDLYALENSGATPVTFFLMKFRSPATNDDARRRNSGGSVAIRWEDVEAKTTDKGFSRVFYNHPTVMTNKFDMHATTLNEGIASHAPHTHAEEEIVLMLRGNGRMNVDGKFYDVVPGQLVFLASEVSHAIENSGKGECEYFAFQWK